MTLPALVHGHHATLITWDRGLEERADEVRQIKDPCEIDERIRHMWVPTQEQIDELPREVVEAGIKYIDADREYCKKELDLIRSPGSVEAESEYIKALATCSDAVSDYDEAFVTRLSELEAWHAKHCKVENCRWNGEKLEGIGE